ncbi:hypothetical protein BCR42DRAFT_332647 [Absidia repens]|uniref:Uncharacterized protein n=1 Tax=Absidia repens TaxID=90262 RepID=A0A1X2I8H5_9FUNG|nr:hypothetical protein BCR42DRAFT_332647 [Absidia repens]
MNHHWRAVARDARQKLVQTPPTELDTIFQLWYIRLLALYQLGLYQLASAEFEKLGSDDILTALPDLLPFEIRVLWAVLPFQMGHPLATLEFLSRLAIQCQKKQQLQRELQVYLIMVTRLIQMNDAHGAAKILQAVLHRVTAMDPHSSSRVDLMTSLGRLYLQLGDLATAERMYTDIEAIQKQYPALDTPLLQETIQTNRALLHMAKGNWSEAKQLLEQVIQQYPENLTAVNNLAVCMVYSGHLSQSMELLDRTTQQHPTTAGTSQVTVMNLCTLYELRFDGAGLVGKKVDVMKQIARWVGDSFNPQCIKLQ